MQTVLEPDAGLTDLVRARLPLPRGHGIKVRAVDGRSGLPALNDGIADLVVLDAFAGAQVPADLTTETALAELHRVLRADGVLALNVTDRGPLAYTRRVLAGLRAQFAVVGLCAEPSTLKGRRFGNVVLRGHGPPAGHGGLGDVRRPGGPAALPVPGPARSAARPAGRRCPALHRRRRRAVAGTAGRPPRPRLTPPARPGPAPTLDAWRPASCPRGRRGPRQAAGPSVDPYVGSYDGPWGPDPAAGRRRSATTSSVGCPRRHPVSPALPSPAAQAGSAGRPDGGASVRRSSALAVSLCRDRLAAVGVPG